MTVVIKPNWVKHEFGDTVGRNVLYHACLARARAHRRCVAGARPAMGASTWRMRRCKAATLPGFRRQSGLAEMEADYARAPVTFLDLRQAMGRNRRCQQLRARRASVWQAIRTDYSLVDLGARSRLMCFGVNARFGVTDYCADNTNGNHRGAHRYLVSNSVLSADVILNVPKLKTHMKTGMTGALKNFVGIIGSKDFLPHFRVGSPSAGGDEYPDRNWLSRAASPVRELLQTRAPLWLWKLARAGAQAASMPLIHGGGWHGNDTLWRTIHDLVDIARNYGVGGALRPQPRTILTLVDAIVAGEDCGPLEAASQAVRSAGVGRRSRHGGRDLRHLDGVRLAPHSAAEPLVRCRGAGLHSVRWTVSRGPSRFCPI